MKQGRQKTVDDEDVIVANEALESEQGLLGALLVWPDKLDRIRETLTESVFFEALHAEIFKAMCAISDTGDTATPDVIVARMGNHSLGPINIKTYIMRLMANASPLTSLPGLTRAVQDASGMRLLQEVTATMVAKMGLDGITDPVPIAHELISKMDAIIATGLSDTARPTLLKGALRSAVVSAREARAGKIKPGISFGIPELDRMTGGARDGELIIFSGRPSMGKTAVATTIALSAARHDVAVFMSSQEMTAPDLAERTLAAQAYCYGRHIPYSKISAGQFDEDEERILLRAEEDLARMPLWIDPRAGASVGQIAAAAHRYFSKNRDAGRERGLLIIDYLGLMRSTDRYAGSRVQEIGETTRSLKALAKTLGVPIILLSQLNRKLEDRPDKRPHLSDLRDSGDIEQDADAVVMLYREEYYLNQIAKPNAEELKRLQETMNILELGLLKQRKGVTGWMTAFCDLGCNVISELHK